MAGSRGEEQQRASQVLRLLSGRGHRAVRWLCPDPAGGGEGTLVWAPGMTSSPVRAEESAHTRDAVLDVLLLSLTIAWPSRVP